jgi:addiction module HigA family antidote
MTKQKIYPRVGRMYNPPHPGKVLYMMHLEPTNTSVTAFAEHIGVDRKTVSRLINGHFGITAEMALRIGKALDTTPDMWLGMQQDYDLWHAEQECKNALKSIKRYTFKDSDNRPHA